MGSLSSTIRIAMLNADTPVFNVSAVAKTYGSIFHNLLEAATIKLSLNTRVESQNFDVVKGEYPKSPSEFDAFIISGSASSAYDDQKWIHRLGSYLSAPYQAYPQIKIFGSCFGHQIICQSLLADFGCKVEKDPNGWEIGVHEIRTTDAFRRRFSFGLNDPEKVVVPASFRLQFIHADHVKIPAEGLPGAWVPVGVTKHCAVQGVYEPGHVLTLQGHFEFDRFVNSETLKVFGADWEPNLFQDAMNQIDADDDALEIAEIVLKFLVLG